MFIRIIKWIYGSNKFYRHHMQQQLSSPTLHLIFVLFIHSLSSRIHYSAESCCVARELHCVFAEFYLVMCLVAIVRRCLGARRDLKGHSAAASKLKKETISTLRSQHIMAWESECVSYTFCIAKLKIRNEKDRTHILVFSPVGRLCSTHMDNSNSLSIACHFDVASLLLAWLLLPVAAYLLVSNCGNL